MCKLPKEVRPISERGVRDLEYNIGVFSRKAERAKKLGNLDSHYMNKSEELRLKAILELRKKFTKLQTQGC